MIKELQANVPDAKVNREYDFLFSGFSVELLAKSIPELLATAGVKAVYPNVEYTVDAARTGVVQAEEVSPEMNESAPYIGANQVWEELGVTGKGVTVAIIDTGVDYTHPDLAHVLVIIKDGTLLIMMMIPRKHRRAIHGEGLPITGLT